MIKLSEPMERISRLMIEGGEVQRLPKNTKWLRVEFGRVWLTDGTRDVVLVPGRTYNPDRPAMSVVSAIDGSAAGLALGVPCPDPSEQARARLRGLAYNRP